MPGLGGRSDRRRRRRHRGAAGPAGTRTYWWPTTTAPAVSAWPLPSSAAVTRPTSSPPIRARRGRYGNSRGGPCSWATTGSTPCPVRSTPARRRSHRVPGRAQFPHAVFLPGPCAPFAEGPLGLAQHVMGLGAGDGIGGPVAGVRLLVRGDDGGGCGEQGGRDGRRSPPPVPCAPLPGALRPPVAARSERPRPRRGLLVAPHGGEVGQGLSDGSPSKYRRRLFANVSAHRHVRVVLRTQARSPSRAAQGVAPA